MVEIKLKNGTCILIDDDDFEKVSKFKWHVSKIKYAHYAVSRINGKTVYLHRLVMDAPKGTYVDHINMNGLDCRKENLRLCTNSQNMHNRGAQKNSKSGVKGVSWSKNKNKWVVHLTVDKKTRHLGFFTNIDAARKRYEEESKRIVGEFFRENYE